MADLIYKQEIIAHLNECLAESDGQTPIVDGVLIAIKCAVEQMPTVEPKKGEWISTGVSLKYAYRCSKCKKCQSFRTLFCSNCGADMREVEE